jgi:hypothetical protein
MKQPASLLVPGSRQRVVSPTIPSRSALLLAVMAAAIALCAAPLGRGLTAAELAPLFANGNDVVTFKIRDKTGGTPELRLFSAADQADTAESINYWRDTLKPQEVGVAVDFKGIRFLRSKVRPDELVVRLVGIKNELELTEPVSLRDLESGKPLTLHFGPVALGFGPISGTTDADLTFSYDPRRRALDIAEVAGQLEWKRPFHDAQKDRGTLKNVTGEIGDVPAGESVLKPAAK